MVLVLATVLAASDGGQAATSATAIGVDAVTYACMHMHMHMRMRAAGMHMRMWALWVIGANRRKRPTCKPSGLGGRARTPRPCGRRSAGMPGPLVDPSERPKLAS